MRASKYLMIVLFCVFSSAVYAGPIRIITPQNGKVEVTVNYNDGSSITFQAKDNGPGDEDNRLGRFQITPVKEAAVTKTSFKRLNNLAMLQNLNFGPLGLLYFEPFDLFSFSSSDTNKILLSDMDVPTFLSAANPFVEGATMSALNGAVLGVSGAHFYDASSLFPSGPSSFFDVFVDLQPLVIQNLPLYSGNVYVESPIEFRRPVPEASSLFLFLIGIAGTFFMRRKQFY